MQRNSESFRVAIVGAVSSYSLHYPEALLALPGVDLVGLAHLDRSEKYIRDALNLPWLAKYPKTIEGMAERFQVPVYETAEELLETARPDGVCICTEDYLRHYYADMALKRGVHVLLPKPFAATVEEAEKTFQSANDSGLVCVGSLPHRFRAPSVAALEAINEGLIGRPVSGHFSIAHHLSLGGWKSDTEMAAGPELEVGFYVFDLARMLMKSEPEAVMGFGANLDHRGIPSIDNGKCLVQCVNGALASIDLVLSMHHPFPPARSFHVIGDEGALTVEGDAVVVHGPNGETRRDARTWPSHTRELGNWIDLCRTGGDPAPLQQEGLRSLELILAWKRAYEKGQPVRVGEGA